MKKIKLLIGAVSFFCMLLLVQEARLYAQSEVTIEVQDAFVIMKDQGVYSQALMPQVCMKYDHAQHEGSILTTKDGSDTPIGSGEQRVACGPITWTIYNMDREYAGNTFLNVSIFPDGTRVEDQSIAIPMVQYHKGNATLTTIEQGTSATYSSGTLLCGALSESACFLSYESTDGTTSIDANGTVTGNNVGNGSIDTYVNLPASNVKLKVHTTPINVTPSTTPPEEPDSPDATPVFTLQQTPALQASTVAQKVASIIMTPASTKTYLYELDDQIHFELRNDEVWIKEQVSKGNYSYGVTIKDEDGNILDTLQGSVSVSEPVVEEEFRFVYQGKEVSPEQTQTRTFDPQNNTFTINANDSGVVFTTEDSNILSLTGNTVTVLQACPKGSYITATKDGKAYRLLIAIEKGTQSILETKQTKLQVPFGTTSITLEVEGGSGTGTYLYETKQTELVTINGNELQFKEDLEQDIAITVIRKGDENYLDSQPLHITIQFEPKQPNDSPDAKDEVVETIVSEDQTSKIFCKQGLRKNAKFVVENLSFKHDEVLPSDITGSIAAMYSLSLFDGTEPYVIDEVLQISLEIPDVKALSSLLGYVKDEAGVYHQVDMSIVDSTITFETDVLGTLILVEKEAEKSNPISPTPSPKPNNSHVTTPTEQISQGVATGDSVMMLSYVFMFCILSSLLVVTYRHQVR